MLEVPANTIVVAGILVREGRVLATRRSRPAALARRWEFPGGKVEAGESCEDALVRELSEELGISVMVGDELVGPTACWPTDDRHCMRVFWCRTPDEPFPGDSHDELRWLTPDAFEALDWLPADVPIATAVAAVLAPTQA